MRSPRKPSKPCGKRLAERLARWAREDAAADAAVAGLNEQWLPIYGGAYEVSSLGRVRRMAKSKGTRPGRMRTTKPGKVGYPLVLIYGELLYVHALVCGAFIGARPEGHEVNHKNGIKTDNRAENLEYVTPSENILHARRTGLVKPAEQWKNVKLSDAQIREIRSRSDAGERSVDLCKAFDTSSSLMCLIVNRKTRTNV